MIREKVLKNEILLRSAKTNGVIKIDVTEWLAFSLGSFRLEPLVMFLSSMTIYFDS